MRIFRYRNIRNESLLFPVEINEHKCGQHQNANDSVASKCGRTTEISHKNAAKDSATTSSQSVMQSLKYSLCRCP